MLLLLTQAGEDRTAAVTVAVSAAATTTVAVTIAAAGVAAAAVALNGLLQKALVIFLSSCLPATDAQNGANFNEANLGSFTSMGRSPAREVVNGISLVGEGKCGHPPEGFW